jgi:asparagine synthase (glutamine-hydrolysing)
MCGISVIISKAGSPVEPPCLERMNRAVAHRGPDGQGEYYWKNAALGHRRLAILDLTQCGHQPMASADDSLVIVFNGEIYNYLELRRELEKVGCSFRTKTDTEVILASYSVWGADCLTRFNGMWAFALLDKKRNRIFCSRDRFGVKPFYYVENAEFFAFGSEIRQLLSFCASRNAVRPLIVDFLLTSICDHTEETFFAGIRKLPGGHNLLYDLRSGSFTISPYYQIARRSEFCDLGPDEAVAAFGSVLESAIDIRLRADVPIGTCLSGGLDSSSIASLAALRYRNASRRSFCAVTAVSEQSSNDESAFASMVAEAGGMDWHTVKPSYRDFVEDLPAVVRAQEEPFGGPSIIMQYFVMKTARERRIPVLLDGQGGDETLLGYTKYYASYLATVWREHGLAAALRSRAMASRNNADMSLINTTKYLVACLSAPMRHLLYTWRHRYLVPMPRIPKHLSDFSRATWDCFNLQVLEITKTNLPVLLRYEDKNSMAHSIEARLPLLDYRAVETALSLPGSVKIRDGWSKWVLRSFMEGRMPSEVVWRRNKFGFEAPERLWLDRHAEVMRNKILASPLLASLSDDKLLRKLWNSLDRRSRWRLYSVALWEEEFGIVT